MPIASPEVYAEMLDRAKEGKFAYPAINISSSQTINAALAGFAEAESDGIIQVSWAAPTMRPARRSTTSLTERSRWLSTPTQSRRTTRSTSPFTPTTARRSVSTTGCAHCWPSPMSARQQERRTTSSRTCGTAQQSSSKRTSLSPRNCLEKCHRNNTILEIEIGVVGGEEDGVEAKHDAKLYSTPEDGLLAVQHLGLGEKGRYLVAATFGNVHGVYKPGNVKLRPVVLGDSGRRRREVRQGRTIRLRVPRRIRIAAVGDQRVTRIRRRQDER